MLLALIAAVWIILSLMLGYIGIKKKIGFYDPFFTSLILSPVLGALLIFHLE